MYKIVALSFVFLLAACGTQKPAKIVMHEPVTAPKASLKPTYQSDSPFKPVYGSVKLSRPVPVQEMKIEDLPKPEIKPRSDIPADPANSVAVKKDDTLYSIARRNGIPAKELARINNLKAPYDITGKTSLKIKDYAAHAPQVVVNVPEALPETGIIVADAPQPRFRPEANKVAVSADGFKPFAVKPSLKSKGKFIWPVKGQVISRFGAKDGGLYNDGVNIAAPDGAPIHASLDGTVVYVGNALSSYGNLLIIRHKNGLLTAYAHTKEILVKKGQKVKLGQVVAKVGQSGNVQTPQVHFGIRDGKKPIDPVKKVRS